MLLKSYRHAPLDAQTDDAPQALKKYRLLGKLAEGGMAELFLARTAGLGGFERLLVIKRPRPELARDTEFVRMLLDEARIVATLSHSNIVQVFDVDMVDGNVFFAMEHLHGRHVAELMRRARLHGAPIPLENAIAVAVAVAAGLHYAHERWGADGQSLGIVHRDVAPNNVIVTYDGNVKLIDFGIAKAVNNLSSTRFGLFKGKLPYASPEQIRCEPVDRRTDVYSLGILLYELTTGFPLFSADNEFELLRLMSEAVVPRPRMRDKAYPRELEQIVLRALARDPAERYPTAQALQRDLEVLAGQLQLNLTAFSLSRLMESMFGAELVEWKTAQRAGISLEEHITRAIGGYTLETLDTLEIEAETPAAITHSMPQLPPRTTEPVTLAGADAEVMADVATGVATDLATALTIEAAAIDVIQTSPAPPTPRASLRWSRLHTVALAIGLVAVGIVVGQLLELGTREDAAPSAAALAPPLPRPESVPHAAPAPIPSPMAVPRPAPVPPAPEPIAQPAHVAETPSPRAPVTAHVGPLPSNDAPAPRTRIPAKKPKRPSPRSAPPLDDKALDEALPRGTP